MMKNNNNASHKTYLDLWWNKGTKHIGLYNYKAPWKAEGISPIFGVRTNGAKRRKGDMCLDVSIHVGYILVMYTNFNLQRNK